MRSLKSYYLIALLFVCASCAQLGLTPPQSLDEKIAYAYGTHTAVLKTAAVAVNAKTMTSAEGEQVIKLADDSKVVLDAARAASKAGDSTTANSKLILATTILTQLQAYLQSRSK